MNNREVRTTKGLQLKESAAEPGYIGVIEGYAIRYEVDSHELRVAGRDKPFVERISKGAFTRSLSEKKDIVAVVDHDAGRPFARQGINLELTEDDSGVHYRARIPDTTIGRDLLTNVRLGILNANSFEFEVRKKDGRPMGVEWSRGAERDTRVIKEAELYHVSPVIEPAYSATSLSARSCVADAAELQQLANECDALAPVSAPAPAPNELATRQWEQRVRFL